MKRNLTGDLEDFETGSLSDRLTESPCESCRVTCHSIHGFVAPPCLVNKCYSCAEIPAIDQEISAAYQHLLNLVQKRTQTIQKRHKEAFIQRLPVEILSMIFLLLKEKYMEEADTYPWVSWFKIPNQKPHLLVSSVCKWWREVALDIPMFWKDITVDLMKSAESQLWIVDEWARRSYPLHINLTICMSRTDSLEEQVVLDDFQDLVRQLRSLSARWNDLALCVPWSFCHRLLDGLEESLSIQSMYYLQDGRFRFVGDDPVKLHRPISPRRFFSLQFFSSFASAIPIQWSSLVYLELDTVETADVLNIIWNAPNLARCVVHWSLLSSTQDLSVSPRYITSHSLLHFEVDESTILDQLTLPSLETLEYSFWDDPELDPFVEFINRSLPPLQTLYLARHGCDSGLTSCFGKLSDITELSINFTGYRSHVSDLLQTLANGSSDNANVFLPILQELTLYVCSMPGTSWSNLIRLFEQDPQPHPLGMDGNPTKFVGSFGRPLSKVTVNLEKDEDEDDEQRDAKYSRNLQMDKITFLRLRAISNSGVGLHLKDDKGLSLLDRIAKENNFDVGIVYIIE